MIAFKVALTAGLLLLAAVVVATSATPFSVVERVAMALGAGSAFALAGSMLWIIWIDLP